MRSSDWSSDVCSSDLIAFMLACVTHRSAKQCLSRPFIAVTICLNGDVTRMHLQQRRPAVAQQIAVGLVDVKQALLQRLARHADRRIVEPQIGSASLGKGCVSTFRYGWAPDP